MACCSDIKQSGAETKFVQSPNTWFKHVGRRKRQKGGRKIYWWLQVIFTCALDFGGAMHVLQWIMTGGTWMGWLHVHQSGQIPGSRVLSRTDPWVWQSLPHTQDGNTVIQEFTSLGLLGIPRTPETAGSGCPCLFGRWYTVLSVPFLCRRSWGSRNLQESDRSEKEV